MPADAHDAIDRLLAGYALYLDSGDVDACCDLFVEDCEFVISDGRRVDGRDALHRFLATGRERGAAGIHLPGPALVDLAGDGKTASVWQNFLFVANGSNTIVRGMYRDITEFDGERWRFRRRHIEIYPGPR